MHPKKIIAKKYSHKFKSENASAILWECVKLLFSFNEIGHVVKTDVLLRKIYCGTESARREYFTGSSRVRYAYRLVVACKEDFMLSNDSSAANRVNTYLLSLARLAYAVAVVDVFALLTLSGYAVGDHDSGTAGSIKLFVVVFLDYLDIKIKA